MTGAIIIFIIGMIALVWLFFYLFPDNFVALLLNRIKNYHQTKAKIYEEQHEKMIQEEISKAKKREDEQKQSKRNSQKPLQDKVQEEHRQEKLDKCRNCGTSVLEQAKFCLNCGKPIESATQNTKKVYSNSEHEFFNHTPVLVTKSRVVIENSTYPVNSLSAVHFTQSSKTETVETNGFYVLNFIAFCFIVGGAYSLVINNNIGPFILISFLGFCFAIFATAFKDDQIHRSYHVTLFTSGTNVQAYTSDDKKEIQDIVKAINEAIIARG